MTLVYELKKIKNIIYSYNTTKKQKAIDAKQKSIQKIWQNEELWLSLLCIYFYYYLFYNTITNELQKTNSFIKIDDYKYH